MIDHMQQCARRWDMVYYILNHKQGAATDIQAAIWYFVDFDNITRAPSSNQTIAWAIINDTLANGAGYIPGADKIVAVICDPVLLLPRPVPVSDQHHRSCGSSDSRISSNDDSDPVHDANSVDSDCLPKRKIRSRPF